MQHSNSKKSKLILETLAQTIKAERLANDKSMRLLADEFEIQRSLLSRIENGNNEPKLISLWTISEALGIKLSTLISKVEENLPKDFFLTDK